MKSNAQLLKASITSFIFIITITTLTAQHKQTMWGMTPNGGSENAGTLFKFDPDLQELDVQVEFEAHAHGKHPGGKLVFIGEKAYGTTAHRGKNDAGVLYEYDLSTNQKKTLHFFNSESGKTPGVEPLAINGRLYGGTSSGGTSDAGVLYEYDPSTGIYSVLHEFDDSTDGQALTAGLCEVSGELYGATSAGGTGDFGTLFKYNLSTNSFTLLHTLVGEEGKQCSYALIENEGTIYGTALFSGEITDDEGIIFKYVIATETFTSTPIPYQPTGSLIHVNGKFYGTVTSGFFFYDAIYEFDPEDDSYTLLRSIGEEDNISSPRNSFFELDGWLYGLGGFGETVGYLYRFNIATAQLDRLREFETTDGGSPHSTLVNHNDILYGAATRGGLYDGGTIFSYNLDDDIFTKLTDFDKNSGRSPFGSLVEANGLFYGTTSNYGEENYGVLFEYNPESRTYKDLLSFETILGTEVFGGVIYHNGILYGTTKEGGAENDGMLYQYDLSTHTSSVLYDFSEGDGRFPSDDLILENNMIYGGTYSGGAADDGVIFEFDLSDNTMNVLHELTNDLNDPEDGIDGAQIANGLLKMGDTLYGTTYSGGLNDGGTLFQYDLTTRTLLVLHHFSEETGIKPGRVIAVDGLLYGTVNSGPLDEPGALFEFNPSTESYLILHHFGIGNDGELPSRQLTHAEGNLYGMASNGGDEGGGIIYRYTIATGEYSIMQSMTSATGTNPEGGLLVQTTNNEPEILIGNPIVICEGSEIPTYEFQATDLDNDALTFTVSSSNTAMIPNASLVITKTMEGKYQLLVDMETIAVGESLITITAADGYGGERSADLSISGLSQPTIGIDTDGEAICSGESVTLTATGGVTYIWEGSVVDGIGFTPNESATYTVIGEGSNGCTASSSIEIVVNPLPVIDIEATDEAICVGEPVTLSGTGATIYSWDSGIDDGLAFTPNESATYTVVGEDSNGCTASSSIEIVVNSIPIISTADSNNLGSIDITISEGLAPYSFDWDNDGVGDMDDSEDLFDLPAGSYSLTVTDSNGCWETASFDIEGILGINGVTPLSDRFHIYPNPISTSFNISFDDINEVFIYDLQGNLVIQDHSPKKHYNIENLDAGVYILRVKINNELVAKKIIKM